MKAKIIKSGEVLETLFNGDEVLNISVRKNGNISTQRLSSSTIINVRDLVENGEGSTVFLALIENKDTEQPTEPETPIEPPVEPEQPEVPPEDTGDDKEENGGEENEQ